MTGEDTPDNMAEMCIDALKETGNIGAARASGVLTKMVGKDILVSVTDSHVIPLSQLVERLDWKEKDNVAVHMDIVMGRSGQISLMFPKKNALWLSDMFLKNPEKTEEIGEMEKEALLEIGNICICEYLNSLSQLVKDSFIPSPPYITMADLSGIVKESYAKLNNENNQVLILDTKFVCQKKEFLGLVLYFPDEGTKEQIFSTFQLDDYCQ